MPVIHPNPLTLQVVREIHGGFEGEIRMVIDPELEWDARALPGFVDRILYAGREKWFGEIGRVARCAFVIQPVVCRSGMYLCEVSGEAAESDIRKVISLSARERTE